MNARAANFTRRTADLPAKFRSQGRLDLLALYHLLQLSDFAREGIAHSGSFRFADHLYRGIPSGRGWLGRSLDRILLNLPAARGMRARCAESTSQMRRTFEAAGCQRIFKLLTVPCGIPRDVQALVGNSAIEIRYTGMDIDPAVLIAAREFLDSESVSNAQWIEGNALDRERWPDERFDHISSTGLGEFLSDRGLIEFISHAHHRLTPGGVFFLSASSLEPRADWLLRAFELHAYYRSRVEIERLMCTQPWASIELSSDRTGLQTFVRAAKHRTEITPPPQADQAHAARA